MNAVRHPDPEKMHQRQDEVNSWKNWLMRASPVPSRWCLLPLVGIEVDSLILVLSDLHVLSDQNELERPGDQDDAKREPSASRHRPDIPWSILVHPEIRRVDRSDITQHVGQRDRHRLLLISLTARGRAPGNSDIIDSVGAGDEKRHREVSSSRVQGRAGDNEADDSYAFGGSNVPAGLGLVDPGKGGNG